MRQLMILLRSVKMWGIDVASNGVKGVVIIDGRKDHSILFELLSDKGSGTLIRE